MSDSYPPLPLPKGISESYIQSHDLKYHILHAGNPIHPLILCLHGFPELAFSWRKVMPAIAAEGYHVIAYDQRGSGRTSGWDTGDFSSVDLNTTTITRLVRDAVILVHALGYKDVACVLGHDFGAVVARSPVLPSHPSNPHPPSSTQDIHKVLACLPSPRKHYKWYYSSAPAASEMYYPKSDLEAFLRGYFYLKSADWRENLPHTLKSWSASELQQLPHYYVMPLNSSMREVVQQQMNKEDASEVQKRMSKWMTDEDLAVYANEFARTGFQGMLNWYRVNTDPQWMKDVELFAGRKIDVPLLFIGGKRDWGTYQEPGVVENMNDVCTKLRGIELVDAAGHWVQQEQPEKVVELVAKFLRDIKKEYMSY
ncbi:epoxide hydrolase [Sclerotinia borealis F-4128]|uniref:Epoxide hydrolase n=1 Tax=Sclerotinia borealis (strain F-4128) TaxID=1432307 RepID=W9CEN9_SCLBF|nr:epoxide hydrolase [Sclerotinia borealis F-4128]